jgi:hypothetical protein
MSFRRKKDRWERNDEFWRIEQRNAQYETLEKLRQEQRDLQRASFRKTNQFNTLPAVAPGYNLPSETIEITTDVNGNIDPRQEPLPPEDRDDALMNQALNNEDSLHNRANENLQGRSFYNLPWRPQLKNRKQMTLQMHRSGKCALQIHLVLD